MLCRVTVIYRVVLLLAAVGAVPVSGVSAQDSPYEAIDTHAVSAPSSAAESLDGLAAYLCKPATLPQEKLRACYRWVTAFVRYDPAAGAEPADAALSALRNRRADAAGFAALYESLSRSAGIECASVRGVLRGWKPGSSEGNEHVWNAVNVDGAWQFVDCLSGAGFRNAAGAFEGAFNEHAFLVAPESLIFSHFPEDASWQKLAEPLSREAFEGLFEAKPALEQLGIRPLSFPRKWDQSPDTVVLRVHVPAEVCISARLYVGTDEIPETSTFVQHVGETATVFAAPPLPGACSLMLFGKKRDEPGSYRWVAQYKLRTMPGAGERKFPESLESMKTRRAVLLTPLTGRLKKDVPVEFGLQVEEATNVALVIGNKWYWLKKTDGLWQSTVTPFGELLQVAARFPGKTTYEVLLRYVVQ